MSRALALVDSSDESPKAENANATYPLLATKLFVPKPRADLVARSRLVDAIRHRAGRKLTVVVAPAGFGKTTLLTSCLADTGWVSLDPSDNEPTVFWSYFIRALQNLHRGVGAQAMMLLRSNRPPAIETILTLLINELDAIEADFTIALDDYHVIDAEPIHTAVTFLLDHLPRRMHLVVASRSDPPLGLPRLRARGELTELRVAEMRFTLDETAAFVNQVMALGLSPNDTAQLERRTEGWITGLKLAALSMRARGDARGFVDAFSGDNRYIGDYLVDEVLRSEPEHIRHFLLQTAILDRMNGALCDAVTGETGSQALLEDLERRNLFVVALDDRREWYRYHHLFADVLQRLNTDAAGVRRAHGKASAWYEAQGSTADAVRHALAADDVEHAADLLERSWPEKNRSYESAQWLDRVKTLPDRVVRDRPSLSMGYAWGLLNSGELEAAEPRLRDVERWLEHNTDARLSIELASARVYLTQSLGDVPGSLEHARRALALVPEGDHEGRITGYALVALALWGRGELEDAHGTFSKALAEMRTCGRDLDAVRGMFVLGDIRAAQGRLRDAQSAYERGLDFANEVESSTSAETDELHLGLSELHREWNDLASATHHLEVLARLAERSTYKGNGLRWRTAMARVREASGDPNGALQLLSEAEQHERRDPLPRVRPIPARKARVLIAQGRMDEVARWVIEAKLSVDDDVTYVREFEHITLARLLLLTSAPDAIRLLERLKASARTGGRTGSVIEILVLESLAQQALGNARGALDHLGEALSLAQPEGYLRVFLDEGSRMRDLLKSATARGLAGAYTPHVLAAFDAPRPAPVAASPTTANGAATPLTSRELEILRLIAGGLRNQEIADQLRISAPTVKRHIANAYGKLGVGHRTEALARAAELKLL
jgi:LuxR family maltose regulon positive regulatory protein